MRRCKCGRWTENEFQCQFCQGDNDNAPYMTQDEPVVEEKE